MLNLRDGEFRKASKIGKVAPSSKPTVTDSTRSRLFDRICPLRKYIQALAVTPARKPKEPQDTTVIVHSNKVVLPISNTLGSELSRTPASRVITNAEITVTSSALNTPTFNVNTTIRFGLRI